MAAEHEEKNTTTHTTSSGKVGAKPGVEVYDTTGRGTTKIVHDEDRPLETTYATGDAGTVKPSTNWAAIIVGILLVLALILLVMWLL